jgi:ribosome-associated toxin RatA of RatAB toxin-antitoxin module
MRNVHLRVRADGVAAPEAYRRIGDFGRYPAMVDVVKSVYVHPSSDQTELTSDWEVYFRNGILRWTERDVFDRPGLGIAFEQLYGDFEVFCGSWQVVQVADGCVVTFDAEFDFGIPSLASILDPIAARVLTETIAKVVAGLLGAVTVLHEGAESGLAPPPAAGSTHELTISAG